MVVEGPVIAKLIALKNQSFSAPIAMEKGTGGANVRYVLVGLADVGTSQFVKGRMQGVYGDGSLCTRLPQQEMSQLREAWSSFS
jgi:hypothetical protein